MTTLTEKGRKQMGDTVFKNVNTELRYRWESSQFKDGAQR